MVKGSAVLIFGSSIAQGIILLGSPIITRIYSSTDYGKFALFSSIIAVLLLFSTARYDMAIYVPRKDNDAQLILRVVKLLSLAFMCVSFLFLTFWAIYLEEIIEYKKIDLIIYLIPVGVFLSAIQAVYIGYMLRNKFFSKVAFARILMAATFLMFSVSLGWFSLGIWGLLVSQLLALLLSTVFLHVMSRLPLWGRVGRSKLLVIAKKYIDYPRVDLPSAVIGLLGNQLPILLFGFFFGTEFLGYYALVDRVLIAPLGIIGGSVGSAYRVNATKNFIEYGEFSKEFRKAFFFLLVVSAIIFFPIFIFGDELFFKIFGDEWETAGKIAQIVAPLYLVKFIASPLSMGLYVRNKMRVDMAGQLLLLLSSLLSILLGWIQNDSWLTLEVMVITSGSVYLWYVFYSWKIARKD
jgi:O-antigen/teichoic acid export membrane protein